MYLSVCSFFEKFVLNVQCIHNAWKWTYIIVIGNCHSRTSCMWQYLIRSQVLYGYTLNTDFLFGNRYWHAADLRYKRNLLSCIWSMLDTLRRVINLQWWGSLTMVPAGNKAKRLSSVNHTTKTIHDHHHHHHHEVI